MIKYINETISRLEAEKNGMEKNSAKWQNQSDTPSSVQSIIDGLNAKEKEIEGIKNSLSIAQGEAKALQAAAEKVADRIENIAIGIEDSSQEQLNIYGIKLRRERSKRQVPTSVLTPSLADDSDGIGFIVSTTKDSDADYYEWQKGEGENPAVTDKIPTLKFFKTSTKVSFVDDDIPKGVRIFYKVRAVNSAGAGPWSEAVSRVQ